MPSTSMTTRPQSRAEHVYAEVRSRILSGIVRGGDWVSIRDVSASLGVSFAPVSDAFRRLEEQGLLETKPGRGCRVPEPSQVRLRDEFSLRMAIEVEAARQAAAHIETAEAEQLAFDASTLEPVLLNPPDLARLEGIEIALWTRIGRASRSQALERGLQDSWCRVRVARGTQHAGIAPPMDTQATYSALVHAISTHDLGHAASIARNRCERALRWQLDQMIS